MDFQAVREQMAAFLRQQGVDAVCAYPEERRRLEQRERDLTPLLREARELQKLTAHYYDRRYQRSGKYTL